MDHRNDRYGSDIKFNGVGDFLHEKTIHFVGPCPVDNVCVSCGVLHSQTKLSKCQHAFCHPCGRANLKLGAACPLDGEPISFKKAKVVNFDEAAKSEYTVLCLNAQHGCLYVGNLVDLEQHVLEHCLHKLVTCRVCLRQVPLWQLRRHRVACYGRKSPDASGCSGPSDRKKAKKTNVKPDKSEKVGRADSVVATLKRVLLRDVATKEDKDYANGRTKDEISPVKPKRPFPISAGIGLGIHPNPIWAQPHGVEILQGDMNLSEPALTSCEGSDREASEIEGSWLAASGSQSAGKDLGKQKTNGGVLTTSLDLSPISLPTLTATGLEPGLANVLQSPTMKLASADEMSSISDELQNSVAEKLCAPKSEATAVVEDCAATKTPTLIDALGEDSWLPAKICNLFC
ncbi:hypothetical protein V5799_009056 [Amblyomma americanum]|uniref:Uncharacterized protein n=1 Tax=Amblyomma americanum TaxID=6943 RepID=A0AAQ4FBQ2_AMBAM